MSRRLIYVREGKMFFTDGTDEIELPSETLRHVIQATKERAQNKEWKSRGSGAVFMADHREPSAEEAVSQIHSRIYSVVYDRGAVYYAMTVNESSGIYRKDPSDLSNEGIILSDQYVNFEEFSPIREEEKLLYTVSEAGEKHIGLLDLKSGQSTLLTEGNTRDCAPFWDHGKILFSSCGLAEYSASMPEKDAQSKQSIFSPLCGPAAICSLDPNSHEISQILGDNTHDYLHPAVDDQGRLLCIRRPYQAQGKSLSAGGCITDVLLFLPRLLWSLVQFLSVFSTMFSGKSLTGSADTKSVQKSQTELWIDGNRIQAEDEQKRNMRAGDKNPGIIPKNWELIRIEKNGSQTVLAKGVCAFLADGTDIYLSNGSAILRMNGTQTERIVQARGVTVIQPIDD